MPDQDDMDGPAIARKAATDIQTAYRNLPLGSLPISQVAKSVRPDAPVGSLPIAGTVRKVFGSD